MPDNNLKDSLEKKRILLVFCSLELGGAERQGLHLARYLKNLGCDVRVWSTLAGRGLVIEECEAAGIPWGIHPFRWPCRKSLLLWNGWQFLRALRRESPDIILPYTTWPNVGCGLTWRWTPARVCIWGQRNIHGLRGDGVERTAYHHVSGVICNAEHEVEYLTHTLGKPTAPTFVVHNGLELSPVQKTRTEWRSDLDVGENAVMTVMVANFREQKDHPTLLRAWAKMLSAVPKEESQPCLVLAGAPISTHEAVQHLAAELGVQDTVRFPGQVKDISGLLAASDIGLLVSRHEGLSNSVLEYMAAGLPVIATDVPGNREALGMSPQQMFCTPGDPEDLAGLLGELSRDAGIRAEQGARNRRRAQEQFSMQGMCESMARIMVELLEKAKRGPSR